MVSIKALIPVRPILVALPTAVSATKTHTVSGTNLIESVLSFLAWAEKGVNTALDWK